jgi:predicted DNA-binding protein (MmcQ/YjbR family)
MEGSKVGFRTLEAILRNYALGLPEAFEEFPWGHRAIKVRGKTFVFMGYDETTDEVSISCKLPQSKDEALSLPFTEPTHYGLGKSGWVSARLAFGATPQLDTLKAWIAESYRAIAPKRLSAQLAEAGKESAPESAPEDEDRPRPARRRAPSKSKKSA